MPLICCFRVFPDRLAQLHRGSDRRPAPPNRLFHRGSAGSASAPQEGEGVSIRPGCGQAGADLVRSGEPRMEDRRLAGDPDRADAPGRSRSGQRKDHVEARRRLAGSDRDHGEDLRPGDRAPGLTGCLFDPAGPSSGTTAGIRPNGSRSRLVRPRSRGPCASVWPRFVQPRSGHPAPVYFGRIRLRQNKAVRFPRRGQPQLSAAPHLQPARNRSHHTKNAFPLNGAT